MAHLRILKVSLLILIIYFVYINAQPQQQQQLSKRQKIPQNQQQQQQQQQQQSKPRPKPSQGNTALNRHKVNKQQNNKPQPQRPDDDSDSPKKFVTRNVPNLGRIRGRTLRSQWSGRNIMHFMDIPYGRPPVGPQRFRPPLPVEPWKYLLMANKPHPGCPSLQEMQKFVNLEDRGMEIEDCLRLTVSTKSFSGKAPVMVYIHGDFLYDGNSVEAHPGYLLEEDIVLVSVRYRLGPFGFLSTMTEDIPGNAAVYDVLLALQWVQDHITHFGGDPKRVTLFGQVGGSAMINILTMSPMVPDGLFHRVIYQSGSALSPAFISDKPIAAARDIAKFAGCRNVNKVDNINKCILNLNATAILEAFNAHGDARAPMGIGSYGGVQFIIGGPSGVLPQHPGKLLATDKFRSYPTLGGTTKNPGTFILKDVYMDTFNETIIDDKLDGPGYIDHIIKQTNGADPTGAWKKFAHEEVFTPEEIKNGTFYRLVPGLIDMCSIIPFKNPVLLAMQSNAKKLPNSTYLYSFDYEGELNRYAITEDEETIMPFDLGVSLTDENLYLFPWPRDNLLNSNRDIKIAKRIISLWTSFAATGVPTAPGVPRWPAMTEETGPYLKIGKTVSVGYNFLDEYTVAVQEKRMGYSLINEEFFESLVEINENESQDKPSKNKEDEDNDDDDEDDDEEDDENFQSAGKGNRKRIQNESRGDSAQVWIAKRRGN